MSPFTLLVLCIQAFLIQSVMSNCGVGSGYRSIGCSSPSVNYGSSSSAISNVAANSRGSYGGSGPGAVSASGNIEALGNTEVVGAVPVMGDVSFSGQAKACGSVSLCGQCGCGCA